MTTPSSPPQRRAKAMQWIEPSDIPDDALTLHPDPVMCRLMYGRGIDSPDIAADFLDSSRRMAPNPFLLPGMEEGVERLWHAIRSGETIGLYGDYDADGVTSVAILREAIGMASHGSADVTWRLAHRDRGYGLHVHPVDELAQDGAELLIVMDCGSTDHDSVAHARSLGLDVVIIDHHHMSQDGPDGAILISAFQAGSLPYREMAAAGLTYLFAIGLARLGPAHSGSGQVSELEMQVSSLADLAALGTVADVAALTGVNRPLVRDGIRCIRSNPRPGVAALCQVSNVNHRFLNAGSIGFQLGPRLNAAGRIGDPRPALELLLEEDPRRAYRLAEELDQLNSQRKRETAAIVNQVDAMFADCEDAVIIASGETWRPGILGNAASRLVEHFGRPVVLLTDQGEFATGSARSVPGLHLVESLRTRPELLVRCGGHEQAAGLTIESRNLDLLRESMHEVVVAALGPDPREPVITIDCDIDQTYLTMESARMIAALGPHGPGNEEPVFRLSSVQVVATELMGRDRSHVRVTWQGSQGFIKAPFFSAASRLDELQPGSVVDLAASVSVGYWNGTRVDVQIKDVRPAAGKGG